MCVCTRLGTWTKLGAQGHYHGIAINRVYACKRAFARVVGNCFSGWLTLSHKRIHTNAQRSGRHANTRHKKNADSTTDSKYRFYHFVCSSLRTRATMTSWKFHALISGVSSRAPPARALLKACRTRSIPGRKVFRFRQSHRVRIGWKGTLCAKEKPGTLSIWIDVQSCAQSFHHPRQSSVCRRNCGERGITRKGGCNRIEL